LLARRYLALAQLFLQRLTVAQPPPVEVRPAPGLEELVAVRNGLGAELTHEAGHAGEGGEEAGQVALVTVVPAEVEVAVDVDLARMREHAGRRDHRSTAVGLVDRPPHRPADHPPVPSRQRVGGGAPRAE